ncbi:MAG: hypothetical protein AVDCRST_MAG85-2041 [uncultured Solirubrobacteraceae bacterium]|uniref:Uncharacterized protein n=1 Tax=uncultured Solirubrobacteraceae bacterium TaxID=1162706 RepID=A0A6J4SUM8_9ACTN|nr:MAG: hypothetical protein AVDCRST_MAG85-2041 [uncultured Solirubrobacteraceae bacterium]
MTVDHRQVRHLLVVLVTAFAALMLPSVALADLGDLDPSYGTEGFAFPVAGQHGFVTDLAPLPGGGAYALVGQNSTNDAQVVKLTAQGLPDTTWNGDGAVEVFGADFDPARDAYFLQSIAVTPDGAIYLGGTHNGGPSGRMAVIKLTAAGTRDAGFDSDGIATFTGDRTGYDGNSVAAFGDEDGDGDADGVVIAGRAVISTTDQGDLTRMGVVAFRANGSTNTTFDTVPADSSPEGLAWAGSTFGEAFDVAVEAGGDVIAAGRVMRKNADNTDEPVWAVARWDDDGAPDVSFGTDVDPGAGITREGVAFGDANTPGSEARLNAVRVVGTTIYVGGYAASADGGEFAIGRYDLTGELDGTWSGDGIATATLDEQDTTGRAVVKAFVVEPGGAVVAAGDGYKTDQGLRSIGIVRFEDDGTKDAVYRGGGSFVRDPSGANDDVRTAALLGGTPYFGGMTYDQYDEAGAQFLRPTLMRTQTERTAPTNEGAPQLSGNGIAKFGETITTTEGLWSGYGTITYEYEWERCAASHQQGVWAPNDQGTWIRTSGCTAIGDATNAHTLTEADVDQHVRAIVTAVNDAGMETRWFSTTQQIEAIPPTSDGPPVLAPNRDVAVGETLQVTDENFSGPTLRYEYQWMRCPTANPPHFPNGQDPCQYLPARASSYTVGAEDAGQHLRVYVQAINSAGSAYGYSATRAVGGSVAGTAPARTADPAIAPSGAVTEGETITMTSPGAFSGTPAPTLSRQWQRCGGTPDAPTGCSGIAGATGESYATGAGDVGKVVRLRVIADNGVGTATADSSGRAVSAKPAATRVERPPVSAPAPGTAAGPTGPTGPAFSTQGTDKMPSVLGKTADEAIAAIAAAGIFAEVAVNAQARKKPLKLNGKALDPGQVHAQSTGAGTAVLSSITRKHKVSLVVNAGAAGIKACQDSGFRKDLKGITLEQAWELLEAKRCDGKVNLNFKVAGSEDEPEVQSASKDGKELRVTVVLPKSHAEMDLFPTKSQGAFPSDPMPSFGVDDWALTADVDNIFGVKVYDRYVGDGRKSTGARVGVGAEVYLDSDRVGVEDEVRKTRPDTGDAAIFSRFAPTKAGTVIFLVQMKDAAGHKIFGYGHFKVKQRSGSLSTIAGETYRISGGRATRTARAAGGPVARAASVSQLFSWVQGLFQNTPLQTLSAGAKSAGEGLISMAKKSAGAVQFALGSVSATTSQLIRMQAGSVVASGGGNVVAAGGLNVIAAGGGNVVAAGGGNAVASGGGNLFGQTKLISGTGSLRMIPTDAKLISDNGLGLISDNGLGLRNASKVIAPSDGAPVVAAGGLNLIGTASGNILNQNNAGIISQNQANIIGTASGN